MGSIAYTVTATLPNEASRTAYIEWLENGHVDAVLEAGADAAMIVSVDEPAQPIRVQTRYVFATRETLEHYLAHHAPALRADGLRRFGPETGVTFSREIGRVI